MSKKISKWLALAALFLFAAAVFRIVNDHIITGAVFFGAAACFLAAAGAARGKEKKAEKSEESDDR